MKKLQTKTQFREATKYIKESANHIYAGIVIFIIAGIFGFIFREQLAPIVNEIIKEIIEKTQGLGGTELTFFILQNNLQSSLFSVILGAFFGIYPIIFGAGANGAIIGYVLGATYDVAGVTYWWRLIPHGIFELPAIFISIGLGIKLGFSLFLPQKIRVKEFKRRFYNSMNAFLMIILPLLIIAAIIEGILIAFIG